MADPDVEFIISQIQAVPSEDDTKTESDLGQALRRARGYQPVVCENGVWQLDAFISYFRTWYEVLRAIDPSLPPGLSSLTDPRVICELFSIPIESTNAPPDLISQSSGASTEESTDRFLKIFRELALIREAVTQSESSHTRKEFYTPSELAAEAGKTSHQIRKLIRDGRILARRRPGVGRGGHSEWEIAASEVQQYLNHGPRSKEAE